MTNIITIEVDIYEALPGGERTSDIHEFTVKLQGEDVNLKSIVEEIRAKLGQWAWTWLHPGSTISIKQKRGG